MLILLAALLLSGPPAVRAEEPPAAPSAAFDPADENRDGTISGKERRRKRRADRRARRGEKGADGELLSDEELDAAEAAESSQRSAAASGKAASAAAALKSSLPSGDSGHGLPGAAAEGASGAPAQSSPPPSAGPAAAKPPEAPGGTGDPGNPRSPSDFALAARSGYAPAFAAAGLKLGPDGKSVVRLDGKPASAEDYARLRREIAALPAALGRRPDFFSAVSPGHYADLKRGYKEKKDGDEVFKDVGTTAEDRDFVHTASCSKLEGGCNKSVEKASYKKGDFVAPEDLDNMWDALQKELSGSADGGAPGAGEARSALAREEAMDAARALTDGGAGEDDAIHSATREGRPAAEGSPPVERAVASARRLWKKVAISLPGAKPFSDGGPSPAWPLAAVTAGGLAAAALFLRRRR